MVRDVMKVDLKKLPRTSISVMKRHAKKRGLRPEVYALQLLELNLAFEDEAMSTPWEKLTEPFRKAFAGMSEEELDAMVERARRAAPSSKRAKR